MKRLAPLSLGRITTRIDARYKFPVEKGCEFVYDLSLDVINVISQMIDWRDIRRLMACNCRFLSLKIIHSVETVKFMLPIEKSLPPNNKYKRQAPKLKTSWPNFIFQLQSLRSLRLSPDMQPRVIETVIHMFPRAKHLKELEIQYPQPNYENNAMMLGGLFTTAGDPWYPSLTSLSIYNLESEIVRNSGIRWPRGYIASNCMTWSFRNFKELQHLEIRGVNFWQLRVEDLPTSLTSLDMEYLKINCPHDRPGFKSPAYTPSDKISRFPPLLKSLKLRLLDQPIRMIDFLPTLPESVTNLKVECCFSEHLAYNNPVHQSMNSLEVDWSFRCFYAGEWQRLLPPAMLHFCVRLNCECSKKIGEIESLESWYCLPPTIQSFEMTLHDSPKLDLSRFPFSHGIKN